MTLFVLAAPANHTTPFLHTPSQLITDDEYWRRRCNARWKNTEVVAHGYSYKQMYFERNLQDAVEQ